MFSVSYKVSRLGLRTKRDRKIFGLRQLWFLRRQLHLVLTVLIISQLSVACAHPNSGNIAEKNSSDAKTYTPAVNQAADPTGSWDDFRTSCDAGEAEDCYNLAVMLRYGRNVEKDIAGARSAYELACKGGVPNACFQHAIFQYEGKGGPQDNVAARTHFGQLCEADAGTACFFYGTMANEGEGGPVDAKLGMAAMAKGCALGDQTACSMTKANENKGNIDDK